MYTPFTLLDHCETLSRAGITEEPAMWLLEDGMDPIWRQIKWDERIRFKKGATLVIKMGDVETPYD
jgi:hypothetical protein